MSCKVILNNPGPFFPGDTVTGKVICDFISNENVRGITCLFRGSEYTAWTGAERYYDNTSNTTKERTINYSGENTFLSVNSNLAVESSLAAGNYEYNFTYLFPTSNIPSSFNGNHGYIRYSIKATVDRRFNSTFEDEVILQLNSPIIFSDIQRELQLNPVFVEGEELGCFCCLPVDPIHIVLKLQKEAFVIGEVIKILLDVSNESGYTISELDITLTMTTKSKSRTPRVDSKTDNELIAATSIKEIFANDSRIYTANLEIPPTTVIPNFAGCQLFSQSCYLNVKAEPGGCYLNINIGTNVKIGHVPLNKDGVGALRGVPIFPSSQSRDLNSSLSPPHLARPVGFAVPNAECPYPTNLQEHAMPLLPNRVVLNSQHRDDDDDSKEPPPPSYAETMRGQGTSSSAPLE